MRWLYDLLDYWKKDQVAGEEGWEGFIWWLVAMFVIFLVAWLFAVYGPDWMKGGDFWDPCDSRWWRC